MYTVFPEEEDVAAFRGAKFPRALNATGPRGGAAEHHGRLGGGMVEHRGASN